MDIHETENPRSSNVGESQDGTSRHGRSKASWGLSTAVHGVGFVAKKVISNRLTDSLWHSRRSNSSASVPSDTLLTHDTKKQNQSPETIYDHTSKPSLNVADEQTAKLPVSSKRTNEREKIPFRGRNVIDPSEISKPQDENQHQWPSTTGSNVIDELENLKPPYGSHVDATDPKVIGRLENIDRVPVKTVDQHRWPSTSGTNVWPSTTDSNVDQLGNLKPLVSSHGRRVNQHRWPTMTSSSAVDQSDNSKPQDGLHAKQVNQHRWPGTVGSNVLNKNVNHPEDVWALNVRRTSLQNHASKNLPESSSDATNVLSSSAVDEGRLKIDKHAEVQPSSPNKSYGLASRGDTASSGDTPSRTSVTGFNPSPIVRGVSLAPATRVGSHTPITRGVSLTPVTRGASLTSATRSVDPPASKEVDSSLAFKEVDPSLTTRGISPSPATKRVHLSSATKDNEPMPPARGVSSTPIAKSGSPPPDILNPIRSSSPKKSCNSNTVFISTESGLSLDRELGPRPTRAVSPSPSRWIKSLKTRGVSPITRRVSPTPARGASPTPTRGFSPTPARGASPTPTREVDPRVIGVSPTPNKSSGTRHFFRSNILSIFSKITDSRREKNLGSYKDSAQYLEILYNIQVQWQFANASSEAVLDLQRVTAEKSLFDVWRTILEIRDSVSTKKIEIDLLILQLKLYAVLYRQMAYIDAWASIQTEYESAVSLTTNDLQARSLSLPITGGVKADIKSLKLVVFSTVQVLETTISCIHSTLSKLEKTHSLASELANVALHERALLDECEIFLASAAPLQIEECSLRSYLMQLDRTCKNE